jgi:inward rectifier potassium channel
MPLRDAYHALLRLRWPTALALIVLGYLALRVVFALAYLAVGGIANARPGPFVDAYAFSIQTMGTIGYGAMYPATRAADALVVAESVAGLLVTAVATGLVFAKVSLGTARVAFARPAAIAPIDGVPTLMIRLGNERGNLIVEATIHVVLTRTEETPEGLTVYRLHELKLVRDRAPGLTRSLTVTHRIEPGSPLHGRTPAMAQAEEIELSVTVVGLDNVTSQTVQAQHRYFDNEIVWGAHYADILSELPDGDMLLDLRRFHELEASRPTVDFPYPAPTGETNAGLGPQGER